MGLLLWKTQCVATETVTASLKLQFSIWEFAKISPKGSQSRVYDKKILTIFPNFKLTLCERLRLEWQV